MCTCCLCGPFHESTLAFNPITSVVCMELYCIVHCTEVMDININPRVVNDTYQTRQSQEVDMKT